MYLEGVSKQNGGRTELRAAAPALTVGGKAPVFEAWKDWRPSQISHHGGSCCETAREWITATDYSALGGAGLLTGPRWLRQKFKWGASQFPIFWCEAVRRPVLDCGALAALAHEVFRARGVVSRRVQLVQKFSNVAARQWTQSWNERAEPLAWISGDTIYHEGCAIETGARELKVWDASAGWWIDPKPARGYGALLAIRVSDGGRAGHRLLSWGDYRLQAEEWTEIG